MNWKSRKKDPISIHHKKFIDQTQFLATRTTFEQKWRLFVITLFAEYLVIYRFLGNFAPWFALLSAESAWLSQMTLCVVQEKIYEIVRFYY